MRARQGQRGQSLVESALALPVLLLLTLGLLQFGLLCWQRVMLQHAAASAARAYTVWAGEDAAQALPKAERAAWLALRGTPQPQSLHVSLLPARPQASVAPVLDFLEQGGPLTVSLQVRARWQPLLRLPFWREGFFLSASSGILNENTDEAKASRL